MLQANEVIRGVAARAESSGVFGGVEVRDGVLICRARASAAPASFRLAENKGRLWVSLVMADRWLSESIEADLMHTGDTMEDLLEEELVEMGQPAGSPVVIEHFRSDDLLFTFRTPVPGDVDVAAAWLLAYEACFRRLGDMEAGEAGD